VTKNNIKKITRIALGIALSLGLWAAFSFQVSQEFHCGIGLSILGGIISIAIVIGFCFPMMKLIDWLFKED
jgi:hypothetical protein